MVRWEAEYIIEHGTLPRAPLRLMAGIATAFLVLTGFVIVGFVIFLATWQGPNSK